VLDLCWEVWRGSVYHNQLSLIKHFWCWQEFEQDVLNLYLEEEQRLHAHELRKREQEAALRWRQVRQQTILSVGSNQDKRLAG
jgi:hypothetical protein